MFKSKRILIISLSLFYLVVNAQRVEYLINENWSFRFSHQVSGKGIRVDLPHTWNTTDALSGKIDYKRGIGNYEKDLFVKNEWKGKRLFLRFEGANTVANVFINGNHIGEHRGGYSAFVFEISDKVNYNTINKILVRVNNAEQLDVMPLVGDFNFYGGIYRDVKLLITEQLCISPLDYASPGVYLTQQKVDKSRADVLAKVILSNESAINHEAKLVLNVFNGEQLVKSTSTLVTIGNKETSIVTLPFVITNPRLWNGRKDPFIYRVEIVLYIGSKIFDLVSQPLGLRFFHIDTNNGFYLNGEHLSLNGVCRHQDRSEIGNALHTMHHDEDLALILEMGANAVRLSHYQQASYFMNLLDKAGIVTWAEIPFVGPGGYLDKGYVDQVSFRENGKKQLIELIRQNYNHPSICFWGLFNELKEEGDNPYEYVIELNELAHKEDPTRPTTAASNREDNLNIVTDLIAWNKYDGWYKGMPVDLGIWLDKTHKNHPEFKIGISEYGAGASIYHQQDSLTKTVPDDMWHPENWQTFYHIENWKVLNARPYVWGTFIWNMFDFGATHRTEGDRIGKNDKGLVTFDRRYKKDAFYFYKTNWNRIEKTLHICEKRNVNRKSSKTNIMVFSNVGMVELFVNGVSVGKRNPDNYYTTVWDNIQLQKGRNVVEVKAVQKNNIIKDSCVWFVEE